MSETKSGIFISRGLLAFGPITTSDLTTTSSSKGLEVNCAVRNWMSSQLGSSSRGTPIDATGPW